MSEERRDALIAEIERKLDLFLSDPEVSEERKAEVVRELLAIAIGEM
jgi:F0F1-type ATP synthase delta subunit